MDTFWKVYKSYHWGDTTFSKANNVYNLDINMCTLSANIYLYGTNMLSLGLKKAQRCTFWKDTTPVTAFFLRV